MKKKSLIGKTYIPLDNSFSVNLTESGKCPYKNEKAYLAGTLIGDEARCCRIVSEPFKCKTYLGEYDMIMVEYDFQTHAVLYHLKGVQEQ